MKLKNGARMALWVGGGGFIGLTVGVAFVGRADEFFPFILIGLALFLGIVLGFGRDPAAKAAKDDKPSQAKPKAAPKNAPRAVPVAPASPDALQIRFDLPDVPAGYPAVMGRGEPLQVKVVVSTRGQPAEGAAVKLSATMDGETLDGDGLTGTGGEVEFTLEPEGVGELALSAEARSGPNTGTGASIVSIVNYEDEIERLFSEFRAYAVGVLGPEAHADTARELCDKLRYRADPQTARALLELARVYELVAYGERTADRRLYLAVLEQLMLLEHAELPDSSAVTREA